MTQKLAVPALVLALVAAQAWYTSVSTTRGYYEELAESVRNPFWVAHGIVYDGVPATFAGTACSQVCTASSGSP